MVGRIVRFFSSLDNGRWIKFADKILSGQINKVALRYYIDFFDFSGLRLDLAFRLLLLLLSRVFSYTNVLYRRLCGKLYLKAETQQVDRILEQFSRRYWDCNPGSVYGSAS